MPIDLDVFGSHIPIVCTIEHIQILSRSVLMFVSSILHLFGHAAAAYERDKTGDERDICELFSSTTISTEASLLAIRALPQVLVRPGVTAAGLWTAIV